MAKVEEYMIKKAAAGKNNNCTLENAAVRREWSVFHIQVQRQQERPLCLYKLQE